MKQLSLSRLVAVACILCAGSAGASAAQTSKHGGDPSRWYHGDSTQQQRMAVLKKELSAAYADQQAACKHQAAGERASCLREARANYRHDSANARQLVADAPQSEVTERIVTTTPAGSGSATEAGATAYGSSGTGATGAGAAPTAGTMHGKAGTRSDTHSGKQWGTQSGAGATGNSGAAGTTGAGQDQDQEHDQDAAPITPPPQAGADNSNGGQSGASQSDAQGQSGTGTAPPIER